jgi:hypothetical protein
MALITNFEKGNKDRPSVHDETEATYYVLELPNGAKMLQIDTYGRSTREVPGKISQSIQLSTKAMAQLKKILDKEF